MKLDDNIQGMIDRGELTVSYEVRTPQTALAEATTALIRAARETVKVFDWAAGHDDSVHSKSMVADDLRKALADYEAAHAAATIEAVARR